MPCAISHTAPAPLNPHLPQAGPGLPAASQEKQNASAEALHLGLGHGSNRPEICPRCGVSMGTLTAGVIKGFHAL